MGVKRSMVYLDDLEQIALMKLSGELSDAEAIEMVEAVAEEVEVSDERAAELDRADPIRRFIEILRGAL